MLSITHAPTCFIDLSPQIFFPYTSTSNVHSLTRKGKTKNLELRFLAVKETSGGGFFGLKNSSWGCEFVRRCNRRDWEGSGGNSDLETKILEFMNSSKNPEMFPSKKQLVDAGRMDLVEAILNEGGWLALGWDFDDNVDDVDVVDWYSSLTDNKDCGAAGIQDKALERDEEQSSQVPCSSSGRSIDIANEDDAGIGGILYRLEKERNMNLGVALKEIETISRVQSSNVNHDWLHKTTKNGDNRRASDDLLKLSDALEFQENEIINAQDKLRSTRAKIAVSEGKVALAIIDAQKVVEEKQKRIDDVSRALQVLRTACIVWPGSASVVFLTGSFDGWAIQQPLLLNIYVLCEIISDKSETCIAILQRRMEKSSVGVFSLYLKLFPGRYEIKFIVDDEWKIDPLRPIVHNNGYENNLLIIT